MQPFSCLSYLVGGKASSILVTARESASSFSAGVAPCFSVSLAVPRQTSSFSFASTRSTIRVPTGTPPEFHFTGESQGEVKMWRTRITAQAHIARPPKVVEVRARAT